jgi:O-antigen/teichoic acid export membrane protein
VGIVQKDALRTTIVSYLGLVLGYLNKGVLFILFLSTEEIGLLSLIVSVGLLFAQFSNLGIAYSVWRFFPFLRNKAKRNFGFFQLSMLVTLIGILVFTVLSILLKDYICSFYTEKSHSFVQYYYWMLPIGIASSLFATIDNFLRSLHKNIVSVIATELILRVAMTVSILFYAVEWISFFDLLVLQSITYIIPTLILFLQLFKNKELHWALSDIAIPKRFKRIILSFSFYSYLNFIGILVVASLDTIMIASMLGLGETGVFATIIYIVSGLLIPYKSLIRITSPFVARYWKERDLQNMQQMYSRISSIGLVMGLFLFLILWVSRVELFHFLPPAFSEGIQVFLILMIGRIVDMYCGINGVIFVTSKKYRYDLIFTGFLLGLVCVMNLWLIPRYGIAGAALSTTIVYVFYNLSRLLFVYFAYGLHPFKWTQLRVMAVFVIILPVLELLQGVAAPDWLMILVKSMLVCILFLVPVYVFRLDADVVNYMNNAVQFILKRLKKSQV